MPSNSKDIGSTNGTANEVSDDLWAMVLRGVDCSGYLTARMRIKTTLPPAASTANNNETNQYFYHSDHLGSASFISDATGYATQHLQYLPYGELFVDQHGAFDSRYKFSAKEKDDETQYSYFGARYYDSDLSIWLSVDPMADEYPFISPYAYCGNNPVMLVDPDGRKVIYEKFRDRVNTILGRIFSRDFNQRFKTWSESSNTYTIGMRNNASRLIYAQPIWFTPLNTDQFQVHYSIPGNLGNTSGLNIDFGINIHLELSIRRSIDKNNRPSEGVKTHTLKNVDPNSPVTFAPLPHPDNINVTDQNGNVIANGSFVAGRTPFQQVTTTNGILLPSPSNLTTEGLTDSKGNACINIPFSQQMTFQVQSANSWPKQNSSTPSRESTSHYRIEWRQRIINININL